MSDQSTSHGLPEPGRFASIKELNELFGPNRFGLRGIDSEKLAASLRDSLLARRENLVDLTIRETGFLRPDAEESIDGCLSFLEAFRSYTQNSAPIPSSEGSGRNLELRSVPWGTVVAILPQNAFLYLALVAALHAVDAGNRVILRAPGGASGTAEVFASALASVGEDLPIHLISASAKDLIASFFESSAPGLLHYFGGSGRIGDLIAEGFRAGRAIIADGEGNTWVYVDESFDPGEAATLLAKGCTRYNGQTCTSVNGAIIHPRSYDEVAKRLTHAMASSDVGPLADATQAAWCLDIATAAGGDFLAGGTRLGARLEPTLVSKPQQDAKLVREGVFGPVMWIAPGDSGDFENLWSLNRYPLCAGIFSTSPEVDRWCRLGNLARLVVNGDPSLEDALEPWGGYPLTGNSSVTPWHEKYRRSVQVDFA